MRGHEQILALRKRRVTPAFIFINDYPCQTAWFEYGEHAKVCTFGDSLDAIDLRFLVGLKVSISATSEARAKALFAMAKAAGATSVGAGHLNHDEPPWGQTGWCEIWHKPETAVQMPRELEVV